MKKLVDYLKNDNRLTTCAGCNDNNNTIYGMQFIDGKPYCRSCYLKIKNNNITDEDNTCQEITKDDKIDLKKVS